MKTLYLDCGMGAAGDMLTAALLELLPDKEEFLAVLNSLGIPGVTVTSEASVKCGIQGTHITVKVNDEEESEGMRTHKHSHSHEHEHDHEHSHDGGRHHHHSGMHEIGHIIEDLPVSEKVKADILAVYSMIAEAESHAHGVPVTEIHFHEVGTMDAVADVTAVCMLMDRLSPDQVVVSPIHVGGGHVKCAHGILPVPAPATAYILRDVPIYGGGIKSELCTPTGASLLKYFATRFGDMPVMRTTAIGYGMGKKDFTAVNCVRSLIGETEDTSDTVTELCCNLDDMTAEAIGFAEEQFFTAGALEAYTVPAQMKKSRPGILLSVMCREKDKEQMLKLIFRHTTTLGVRENASRRYTLSRTTETVRTNLGEVRKKISSGYGVKREKYEYEDMARIAREQDMSLAEVTAYIKKQEK
ncbi:nickel pincer cofactor biosynthesis protein LarC [Treponema parvum]|uniref:Putative nickel insertion protein n=1 Tax=Treponema parvum TaxID=138851 RepID=A0A975F467_9SPIR|nr:nickel pincer cofactor biosynthesis protein LarC [Treponema parvum]QTQ14033.1 nickel pincer cofactor biosynthesis protein LarC [Treponema parvum]